MTADIEDLVSSLLDREPVGPAPTALIRRRARRRRLTRRGASVAAAVAVLAGLAAVATQVGDGGSSDVTAAEVDEPTTTTTAAASPVVAPTTPPDTAPSTATTPPPTTQPGPSIEERRAVYDRMEVDRESLRQGELDPPELVEAGASDGRYDLALSDTAPYTITVSLPTVTDEAVGWFNNRYGAGLSFVMNESATGAPPSAEGAPLWGRRFDAVAASENGVARAVSDGTFLEFADGRASMMWSGGCNTIGGWVTVTADVLDVGQGGGTSMSCTGDGRMDNDEWVTDLMRSDPRWVLNGDRLTVSNDHATLELVLSS